MPLKILEKTFKNTEKNLILFWENPAWEIILPDLSESMDRTDKIDLAVTQTFQINFKESN